MVKLKRVAFEAVTADFMWHARGPRAQKSLAPEKSGKMYQVL
jgi:hypothetical protein